MFSKLEPAGDHLKCAVCGREPVVDGEIWFEIDDYFICEDCLQYYLEEYCAIESDSCGNGELN